MRILIVSQYFEPELTAASIRIGAFARGLAAAGHEVDVLCEVPNHPVGVVAAGYSGKLKVDREEDGFRVRHVWVHASPSKRARHRLLSYASFAAMATTAGSAMPRPDVIVASSPPLSVGVVGALLASRFRVPLVFDVRDLWPEVAVALGELPEGPVLRFAERLERWLYRRADAVTTPTRPFRDHIAAVAGPGTSAEVVGNGTDARWIAAGQAEPDRASAGLDASRFSWTYAGNIGLSQDLGTAIAAASELGDGFDLLLLGDGTSKPALEAMAASSNGSVRFRDSVPAEQAMQIMRASDALLVSLADRPELGRSVPIKLYDSCAVGRPVVLAAPGEPRRLAGESGAALVVPPEDPGALAAAIRRLRDDPELARSIADAGVDFARANLRELGVAELEALLLGITGERA